MTGTLFRLISIIGCLWLGIAAAQPSTDRPQNLLPFPETVLGPAQLAVVVNTDDPASVEIARYYRENRGIPDENLIQVQFKPGRESISRKEFAALRQQILALTPPGIQGYALAWTLPFAVDCMSVTSALAFGFDPAYCSARRCALTKPSPYFASTSRAPFRDHHIRPAMLLAGTSVADVKRLIDRGLASDHSYPTGTGYLVATPDAARSVRAAWFNATIRDLGAALNLQRVDADGIRDRRDVLFYFTGMIHVPYLDTLGFRPGALADHLTSVGGWLTTSGQMSSLRWLEAGATASYGTVVEPCNHPSKFPFPGMAIWHYASGDTALEAYWKSVQRPGEGVFIGDPLAAPFAPRVFPTTEGAAVEIFAPENQILWLNRSAGPIGPYQRTNAVFPLKPGFNRINIPLPRDSAQYRLELVTPAQAGSGQTGPAR